MGEGVVHRRLQRAHAAYVARPALPHHLSSFALALRSLRETAEGTKMRRMMGALALLLMATGTQAQPWQPDRPITVINPYAAGSTTDGLARALAPGMAQRLGQPVVVQNRDGAAGGIGTAQVARAAADGHTLLFAPAVVLSVLPARGNPGYGPEGFLPVCQTFENAMSVVVLPESPHRTLADLVAAARARPGALTFGHQGVASIPHLAMLELAEVARFEMQQVPYRGEPAVIVDLRAGRVDAAALVLGSTAGQGLRVLAVFAPERHSRLPDVPTAREQGFDVAPTSFGGLFAPAGTPPAAIAALEAACLAAAREEAYRQVAARAFQPADPVTGAAALSARLARDVADKRRLLATIGEAR
jgi:tripartite-type tricarboxylate transporter receptor subunit TctC